MSAEGAKGEGALRIAVVPGDGIGVDVTKEALKVLNAAAKAGKLDVATTEFPWSADHYLKTGESLPKGAFDDLRANYDAIFMGAFGDPRVPDMAHARDILLGARFVLDLYVNARPIRCLDDRLNPLKGFRAADIDFVIFRENTEGSYAGTGGNFKKGTPDEVALQEDISTRKGVERIVRHAFEFAKTRGKKKVCMSDKSNAMRFVGDLWQRTFWEIAKEYPTIEASHLYVDALVMQMVKDPTQFEVVVTNNMFGDITTDLGAALQGGLGMAASGNLHPGQDLHVRTRPRLRAEIRGHGKGEPVRSDPDRGNDARAPRSRGVRASDRIGRPDVRRTETVHGGHRRLPNDFPGRRRRRFAARLNAAPLP